MLAVKLMVGYLCPPMKASPPVVVSSPVSILNVVVFPAPFTPSRPKHSPGLTPRHNRSTARMRPIFLDLYTCHRVKMCHWTETEL